MVFISTARSRNRPSGVQTGHGRHALARFFWSQTIKHQIAAQLENIRHWKLIEGDYSDAPDVEGHWLVDPPYGLSGIHYRYHRVNYNALAKWCMRRKGFVQVCENVGATWLPFEKYADSRNPLHARRGTAEAVYQFESTALNKDTAR